MLYPTYLRRSDPFALMRSMMRDLDRGFWPPARAAFPAVNVWQGPEAVAIAAELPGIEPGDIEISVKDNVLTLSGERKAPEVPDGARWHRNERGFGRFSRTIRLPFAASDDKVEARMTNGVLRIVISRPEEEKPKTAYWDHPRGCGAHFITNAREKWYEGSSPRVRGSLRRGRRPRADGGIIPAGAGLTVMR